MNDDKIQELLIQLARDVAVISSKLDALEEMKADARSIGSRVDSLEVKDREHDECIKSLKSRADAMEKFTRDALTDTKKQQTSIFITAGVSVFSAILSLLGWFIKNLFI